MKKKCSGILYNDERINPVIFLKTKGKFFCNIKRGKS